jgi:L-methionine (R)-S-oxide reductase
MAGNEVLGEIDIDSDRLAAFDASDRQLLESVAALLAGRMAGPRR